MAGLNFQFKYKLAFLISTVLISALLVVFSIVERSVEAEFRQSVVKQLDQAKQFVSQEMSHRFQTMLSAAIAASEDTLIRDIITDKTLDKLTRDDIIRDEILPNFINVDLLVVTDPDGNVLANSLDFDDSIQKIVTQPWFADAIDGYEVSGYIVQDNYFVQTIVIPVYIATEMIGIVIIGRQLDESVLSSIKSSNSVDLIMISQDPETRIVLNTALSVATVEYTPIDIAKQINTWIKSQNLHDDKMLTETQEITLLEERFLVRFTMDKTHFVPPLFEVRSLDLALVFLNKLKGDIAVIGITGITLGVIVGLLFAIGVSLPIRKLRDGARQVSQGNYATRVDIKSRDEFAELGAAFNSMIIGLEEKERIRRVFDKSVSREVAEHMLNEDVELGGEKRQASILFSDIRGFTGLSEKLDSSQLIELLNGYFTKVNVSIQRQKGTIDKFIGDAIMALFGAPVAYQDHAYYAVLAACEMLEAAKNFNNEIAVKYGCEIKIGVGVNTGILVAGLVGSEDRLNYTVLGEAVNMSSRLEGLTKFFGAEVIISEYTLNQIHEFRPDAVNEFEFRMLDSVQVKGSSSGVKAYQVWSKQLSPEFDPASNTAFQEGLKEIHMGNFEHALSVLDTAVKKWPEDVSMQKLRDRAAVYQANNQLFKNDYTSEGALIMESK